SGLQHALASSRPPRLEPALPRPQLRRHPDRVGPPGRELPARERRRAPPPSSTPPSLDRNYGGILIVGDRLFGTFEPESEPVRFGLTHDLGSHNPLRIAFQEFAAVLRDAWRAPSWRLSLAP